MCVVLRVCRCVMRDWGLVESLLVLSGGGSNFLCFWRFFHKEGQAWNVGRGFVVGVYVVACIVQVWVLWFGSFLRPEWGVLVWFSWLGLLHLGSYVANLVVGVLFPEWEFVGDLVQSTRQLRGTISRWVSCCWVDIVLCVSVLLWQARLFVGAVW